MLFVGQHALNFVSYILGCDGSCTSNLDKDQFIRCVRGICHYDDLVPFPCYVPFLVAGAYRTKVEELNLDIAIFHWCGWRSHSLQQNFITKWRKVWFTREVGRQLTFAPQLVGHCGDLGVRKNFVSACLTKLQYMGFLFAALFYLRVKRRVQRKYMIWWWAFSCIMQSTAPLAQWLERWSYEP